MKGTNTIQICQAQMVLAMEHYLKDYIMKDHDFVVDNVKPREQIHFDIFLKEKDTKPPIVL